jgi:hypothetical protein
MISEINYYDVPAASGKVDTLETCNVNVVLGEAELVYMHQFGLSTTF